MTLWIANTNGNFTANSWGQVDATSLLRSESGNTALTTSAQASSTFTPGAITIDSIALEIASRATSPSGTMTVQLFDSTASSVVASVTINVSDIPTCTASSTTTNPVTTAEGGWMDFFIGSTTLTAGHAYSIRALTSVSSQVNLWTNGTGANWSRMLRTTTAGTPAAGDDWVITAEWTAPATSTARTITMDSTAATAYGSNTTTEVTPAGAICTGGTLSYGTSASTNYILNELGHIIVYNGGTLNVGTSGTPIPSGSTATLEFNCTNAGDFGLVIRNGATFNAYGVPRTAGKLVIQTKLTANLAAAGTSVSVADDTGWLSGDSVCFAPTKQTFSQFESRILSGNASSGGFSITSGVTNAHDGLSPVQGEVGLLTHNVVFTSTTTTKQAFVWWGNTCTVNIQWSEFSFLGNSGTKPAICANTTTGSSSVTYSSIHDSASWGIFLTASSFSINNITFQNCVVYNSNTGGGIGVGALDLNGAVSGTNWTFDHIMFCGNQAASNTAPGAVLSDVGGTFTNNSLSGMGATTNSCLQINEGNILGTFSNIVTHSNNGSGIIFNSTGTSGTISNVTSYRNAGSGIAHSAASASSGQPIIVNGANIWANGGGGSTTGGITIGSTVNLVLINVALNGDTSFVQENGIEIGATSFGTKVMMHNCNFSTASGILIANAFEIGFGNQATVVDIFADSCIFAAANLFEQNASVSGGYSDYGPQAWFRSMNHNQVANDNRAYYNAGNSGTHGLVQTDTSVIFNSAVSPRSQKMTPNTSLYKLQSAPIIVSVNSGQVATVSVQVQKNSAYTGNAPRLILKRQDAMGVTADTVLSTFSAGANVWQQQTGSSPAAPQDGNFVFMVDCDGTAGSSWVDGETASAA